MSEKLSKKQRKKEKAKEKALQSATSLNRDIKLGQQQTRQAKATVRFVGIPKICCSQQKQGTASIIVKNKKITILQSEVIQSFKKAATVEIVGEDLQIPKTISLVEIVKRQLEDKCIQFAQKSILGHSAEEKPCIKVTLSLAK